MLPIFICIGFPIDQYPYVTCTLANSGDTELLMGDISEAQKDHASAIASYRRALELQGNKAKIMVSLARAYLRTGRYSAARELLTSTIEIEPENSIAYQYLGFAQLKLGQTDSAIASYQKAVELNDTDWMAHKSLGVAYMLKAINTNKDKSLKRIDSVEIGDLKAKALSHWNRSLDIKTDQTKLVKFVEKYSN